MDAIKDKLVNPNIQVELKDGEYIFWIDKKKTVSCSGDETKCLEQLPRIEEILTKK